MSWWDSKNFTNLATKALKTAQQHIDKALDIREEDESGATSGSTSNFTAGLGGDDFWDSYLGSEATSPASVKSQRPSKAAATAADSSGETTSNQSTSTGRSMAMSSKPTITQTAVSAPVSTQSESDLFADFGLETLTNKNAAASKSNTIVVSDSKKVKTSTAQRLDADTFLPSKSSEIDVTDSVVDMQQVSAPSGYTLPQQAVATLNLNEPQSSEICLSQTDSMSSFANVESASSLFDMSGSSIMQDSQANWGDDVSLSVLVESTMSLGDDSSTKVSKQDAEIVPVDEKSQTSKTDTFDHDSKTDCDRCDTDSEIVDSSGVAETSDDALSQAQTAVEAASSLIDDASNMLPETEFVSNAEQKSCTRNETAEACVSEADVTSEACVSDADVVTSIASSDMHVNEPGTDVTVKDSDTDTGMVVIEQQQAADGCESSLEHIPFASSTSSSVLEQSDSFTMDGSQTSSSVGELSSSNRTLTTDDLQVLELSPEVTSSADDGSAADAQQLSGGDAHKVSSDMQTVAHAEDATMREGSAVSFAETESKAEASESHDSEVHYDATSGECSDSTAAATAAPSLGSSGSFVVTHMLEEAMAEVKDGSESHCDDSHSHSSSDMVRIESGQNSELTSADELETATSSDIEIISHISTPSSNNGADRLPFTLNSLRVSQSRSQRRYRSSPPGHHRTDSDSSCFSVQSKNGEDVMREQAATAAAVALKHDRDAAVENVDNPYETEKLLKEPKCSSPVGTTNLDPITETSLVDTSLVDTSLVDTTLVDTSLVDDSSNLDSQQLLEKLAEMAEVLEAREKKLVDLSRANMDLTETNSILRNQLQQSEEAQEEKLTDLNQLTSEYTARISEAERRLNQATKERDSLKRHASELEALLTKRSDSSSSAQKMLLEKDQQIAELLEEGEKLSKQQLQSNNIIKKLRGKEKETDAQMKTLREKVETQRAELDKLKKILDNKCDVEKQQSDSIQQLQGAVTQYDKEIDKLKTDGEELQEKNRSLQAALDNSYKEIAELHKANVMKASHAHEEKLSSELQAKQQLQIQLDRQLIQAKQEQEGLLNQIDDLRLSMSRLEKETARREDVLKQEISDLQQRLQEGEDRNQELTQGVTAATRPLLRQIENLQSTYAAQTSSYEKVERNLTERLNEAQLSLATAQEKERVAAEQLIEGSARLATLESQVTSLKQERSRLMAQLEMERTRIEVLEDAKNNFTAQRDALQTSYDQELSQLKKEKLLLENQCEMEKIRVETERKKVTNMAEQLKDKVSSECKKTANIAEQLKDKELQMSSMLTSRSLTPKEGLMRDDSDSPRAMATSMTHSMTNSFFSAFGDDTMDKSFVLTPNGGRANLYESLRHTGAATLLENLQSQVKQQDGEIVQLQNEIRELERTRESMARELVNLANSNQEQSQRLEELDDLKKSFKELDQRYNALLQMYGEKVEEAQELRMDLFDIKDLYKSQIDELLSKQ